MNTFVQLYLYIQFSILLGDKNRKLRLFEVTNSEKVLKYYGVRKPDISYAANLLSRFCEHPGEKHWDAVKRVFRYLEETMGYKLRYDTSAEKLTKDLDIHIRAS